MGVEREELLRLEEKARDLRKLIIDTVVWAGSGHVGGALSSIDIITLLYYKYLNIDPTRPDWEDRDRFILSKGHIGVGFAPVLADLGFIDHKLLKTYNHTGSELGMHLDRAKVPGLDASTGSLGHGLPIALGLGLSARLKGQSFKTYCLMGDGECDEGSIWEAAMAIAHYKLTSVIPIVDRNRCMIDGRTNDVMILEPFCDKWRAFGFNVIEVDGHDMPALCEALDTAAEAQDKPIAIIANTKKGCGVEFMADNYRYHYASFDAEKAEACKIDIDKYHDARAAAL
ncbi:MAG: transketolase [Spirochaetales bacterium]|nr:transketolase [Spirochaetales bacterium]